MGAAFRRQRHPGAPGRWSRFGALVVLLPLVAVDSGEEAPAYVSAIEVVPGVVVVATDPAAPTTFALEARLWSGPAEAQTNIKDPKSHESLKWNVGETWLHIDSTPGHRIYLRLDPGVPPGDSASVTAQTDLVVSPRAWVVVANANTLSGRDVVSAAYTAGMLPSVALASYRDDTGACVPKLYAFVRRSRLGMATDHCTAPEAGWEAAVLAVDYPMAFTSLDRVPGEAAVADAGAVQGPTPSMLSIPIALRVRMGGGVDPAVVTARAMREIIAANAILRENRTGVAITVVSSSEGSEGAPTTVGGCPSGDAIVDKDGAEQDSPPLPAGTLHVYYVNQMGSARGITCPGNATHLHESIFISNKDALLTTLAHEVGHALGLTLPLNGHADDQPGFDVTNVMQSELDITDTTGRQWFSVGQVFRMIADSGSWLNRGAHGPAQPARVAGAPTLGCQCGAVDPVGVCPRTRDDVAAARRGKGTAHTWDCSDRLLRLNSDLDAPDEPVGLFAGRRRRARFVPGECTTAILARTEADLGPNELLFENLTRPAGCPSWAAIFTRRRGVEFLLLDEASGWSWNDTADLWSVTGAAPDPVHLAVILYVPSANLSKVKADTLEALTAFGEANRTGIILAFSPKPYSSGALSACPVSTLPALSVCYPASGGEPFALAHRIGAALGLPAIPPGDQHAAFRDNVMQVDANQRAGRLTLGQVFRLNALLRPGEFPNCGAGTDKCPPLSTDAR